MKVLQRIPRPVVLVTLVLVVALALLVRPGTGDDPYELRLLMPAADGVVKGTPVRIAGREAGKVTDVSVEGNAAEVTVEIDEGHTPLHAGTVGRITWYAVLGRREVEIKPGDEANAELPSGKVIRGNPERVELDDIVAALDAPTRRKVRSLVADLERTISPNARSLRETLLTAGPFAKALGEVLMAVGQDGPAIRNLLGDLRRITTALASRDDELSATVSDLTAVLTAAAQQQERLRTSLDEVGSTVDAANRLFGEVPDAVDAAVPLLEDLRPATDQLPAVSARLKPVLMDLRPVVDELRPTLAAAQQLLGRTPALLDNGTPVVSDLDASLTAAAPAVSFLRPYTPEVVGFLTNWTSLFSAKNAAGHFGRAMVPASVTSFNSNPGVLPPGMDQWQAPLPGQLAEQPWTDANGDGVH